MGAVAADLGIEVVAEVFATDAAVSAGVGIAAEAGFEGTVFDAAVITTAESSMPAIVTSLAMHLGVSCLLPPLIGKPSCRS